MKGCHDVCDVPLGGCARRHTGGAVGICERNGVTEKTGTCILQ
jgi:hypothetical protein